MPVIGTNTLTPAICVENRNLRIERWRAADDASLPLAAEYPGLNELVLVLDGTLTVTTGEEHRLGAGDFIAAGPRQSFRVARVEAPGGARWLRCVFHGEMGREVFPATARRGGLSVSNVFAERPRIVSIAEARTARFDIVTSWGHASQDGAECESSSHEWLVMLRGSTVFTRAGEEIRLSEGDEIYLPPNVPNGVKSTAERSETVWLAVFFRGAVGAFDTKPRLQGTPPRIRPAAQAASAR